jgi:hypothetical protein
VQRLSLNPRWLVDRSVYWASRVRLELGVTRRGARRLQPSGGLRARATPRSG